MRTASQDIITSRKHKSIKWIGLNINCSRRQSLINSDCEENMEDAGVERRILGKGNL